MITCLEKYRNRNGIIIGYLLLDESSGRTTQIEASVLKNMIKNNNLKVSNLKLTSDDRVIDSGLNMPRETETAMTYSRKFDERFFQQLNSVENNNIKQERKNKLNRVFSIMSNIGSIAFTGKTSAERKAENLKYKRNNQVSWEHNYNEARGEFGYHSYDDEGATGDEFGDDGGDFE